MRDARKSGKHFAPSCLCSLAGFVLAVLVGCVHLPRTPAIELDESLIQRLDPGRSPRLDGVLVGQKIAAVSENDQKLQFFVEDHLTLVTRLEPENWQRALRPWNVRIVEAVSQTNERETAYLVRIDPAAADLRGLDAMMRARSGVDRASWKVSSLRGMQLLAATREINAMGGVWARPVLLSAGFDLSAEQIAGLGQVRELVAKNCGVLLQQEARLIADLAAGGRRGQVAEQTLAASYGSLEACGEPVQEKTLTSDGRTVLDPGNDLKPYSVALRLPQGMPQATQVEVVREEVDPDSLFDGALQVTLVGDRIGIGTPARDLPRCARSENFTLRVTFANGRTESYWVRLPIVFGPVRFEGPLQRLPGPHHFNFTPGVAEQRPLCVAGDRTPVSWSWVPAPDPLPAGLALSPQTAPIHRAVLGGTPNVVTTTPARGRLRAVQGSSSVEVQVSIEVGVQFIGTVGPACGDRIELEPGSAFTCELPRPQRIAAYNWSVASGSLPPGLNLTRDSGGFWHISGTVPMDAEVRGYPLQLCLLAAPAVVCGSQPLARRNTALIVTIPFSVWAQNAQLRPSGFPFIPNIDRDNEERAQQILNRIPQFDIVALSEVFDEEQRRQFESWYAVQLAGATLRLPSDNRHQFQALHFGPPTEEAGWHEESGLAVFARTTFARGGPPSFIGIEFPTCRHYNGCAPGATPPGFRQMCAGSDCLARKGFTITKVRLGEHPEAFVWLVNTHMQASEPDKSGEAPRQAVRLRQLELIKQHVVASDPKARHPVLLVGDTNVAASTQAGSEYQGHLSGQGPLNGWQDVVQQSEIAMPALPNDLTPPFTWNQNRNAYAHFWDDHLLRHYAASLPLWQCLQLFNFAQHFCREPLEHPTTQERLDHILIRQGTDFVLQAEQVRLEDQHQSTRMCASVFARYQHPGLALQCYLSDHFGVSARLRLRPAAFPQ
jgi:hypothetical protein